jgi:hypothetical protein
VDSDAIHTVDQRGFGSVLLENAIVQQLGGQFARRSSSAGIEVAMTFSKARMSR